MHLIILEGPDGSGKSTLANELDKCGYAYVHSGIPDTNDIFHDYLKTLIDAGEFAHTVIDRLHLGERIYGEVMRGESKLTELQERLIERYLYARGGQVVICLPPWRTVLNNWLKTQENEYVDSPKKLRAIYGSYYRLLRSERSYMHFDYTRHRVESFAQALCEMNNYGLPETWVGSPNARFLFVGERANGLPDLPFMEGNNSSGYLHSCIEDAGYAEDEIAFTNAYQASGKLNEFLLKMPNIIALGNVAHVALRDTPHHLVAHPAHWKRFHTSERNKYVSTLSKIRRGAL